MKVAPLFEALARVGHTHIFVHTGQHYDAAMSDTFLRELAMPVPDEHLEVGSDTHARQTARLMERFEPVLLHHRPDWVVVVGDVNSTLACALVAAKLRNDIGCRVAHVEAGLRSNDWTMPEEVNRVLTDRLSDLLLTPSRDATPNLLREGIDAGKIEFVGNVMIDSLLRLLPTGRSLEVPTRVGVAGRPYVLVTLHRPSNVDDPDQLRTVLSGLGRIAKRVRTIVPLHPRTRDRIRAFGLDACLGGLTVLDPLGYSEMLGLMDGASVVLTDSGGVQEETTVLGVPCVTLRAQTERPVTVTEGTNRLAPWPLTAEGIEAAHAEAEALGRHQVGERSPEGWDGHAAPRIVEALTRAS
jgi:UDP-N-acetylglucosamine 2-epimerase (non-hydrolysing)